MMTFQTKIEIDPEALRGKYKADWEAAVVRDLNKIWGLRTGRAVLNNILHSGKTLRIQAYHGSDVNATTTAR